MTTRVRSFDEDCPTIVSIVHSEIRWRKVALVGGNALTVSRESES